MDIHHLPDDIVNLIFDLYLKGLRQRLFLRQSKELDGLIWADWEDEDEDDSEDEDEEP